MQHVSIIVNLLILCHTFDTGCPTWIATKVNQCCDYVCLSQTLFPSHFCWKHVYNLIFGIKKFQIFQRVLPMIWDIFQIFNFSKKKMKNPQIIVGPFNSSSVSQFEDLYHRKIQNLTMSSIFNVDHHGMKEICILSFSAEN